ncbi:hypothetical protein K439DRAFT_1648545 [Ramaria rubella]|nr:hypothetical protein K439DRAFT_1648545 [Ramaria rubella]
MADIVTSTLNYFDPPKDGTPAWVDATTTDATTGQRASNAGTLSKEVQIENVRGREDAYSLDTAGFQYIVHRGPVRVDFDDDDEIERVYYPDCVTFLKKVTGAGRVIIFDHTRVHVDQTPGAAQRRVHAHAPPELVPELLKHRYQIINLWRPIGRPAHDFPLALCDYRTVDWERDLVPTVLKYADRVGETFSVQYSPEHKWKYLRGMRPDEGVLIKCFDSKAEDNVAVLTPHTAFVDPTTPKDAPYRESIEVRALVLGLTDNRVSYDDDLPNGA